MNGSFGRRLAAALALALVAVSTTADAQRGRKPPKAAPALAPAAGTPQDATQMPFEAALEKAHDFFFKDFAGGTAYSKLRDAVSKGFGRLAKLPEDLRKLLDEGSKDVLARAKTLLPVAELKPLVEQSLGAAAKGLKATQDLLAGKSVSVDTSAMKKALGRLGELFKNDVARGFGFAASLQDRIKGDIKRLLWVERDGIGPDPAKDALIQSFFRDKLSELTSYVTDAELAGVKPFDWPSIRAVQRDIIRIGTDVLTTVATPAVRIAQLIRTKVKRLIEIALKASMTAAAEIDRYIDGEIGKLKLPPWFLPFARMFVEYGARIVGVVGAYVLKEMKEIDWLVVGAVNAAAGAADTVHDALGAIVAMGVRVGASEGDDAEAGAPLQPLPEVVALARKLVDTKQPGGFFVVDLPGGSREYVDTLLLVERRLQGMSLESKRSEGGAAEGERLSRLAKQVAATRAGLVKALAVYDGSSGSKRKAAFEVLRLRMIEARYVDAYQLKRGNVVAAVRKVLKAVRDAVVAYVTPLLIRLCDMLNMALSPVWDVVKGAVRSVISMIPYAGGVLSWLWEIFAGRVLPVIINFTYAIVVPVFVDLMSEEILDFEKFFMSMWDDPKERRTVEGAQKAMKNFYEAFKLVKAGLEGLRQGIEEGAAALVEGPLVKMLLSKLPLGLHELAAILQKAVQSVLRDTLKPGEIRFDFQEVALNALNAIRQPLRAFLVKAVPRRAPDGLKDISETLGEGFTNAYDDVIADLKKSGDLSKLLSLETLQTAVVGFLRSDKVKNGLADFLVGRLQKLVTIPRCPNRLVAEGSSVSILREGIKKALSGLAALVANGKESPWVIFQQEGPAGFLARLVRELAEPPAGDPNGDGVLTKVFLCILPDKIGAKWQARFRDAARTSWSILGDKAVLEKILAGGLTQAMGALLKIVSAPLAGVLADGLGEPLLALESELAEGIRNLGNTVATEEFAQKFARGDFRRMVAAMLRVQGTSPSIRDVVRRFIVQRLSLPRDAEVDAAFDASWAKLVVKLEGSGAFDVVGTLRAVLLPIGKVAFKKMVAAGAAGAQRARQALKERVQALVNGFQLAGPEFAPIAELRAAVIDKLDAATDAAIAAFSAKVARCADDFTEDAAESLKALVTCVKNAGNAMARSAASAGR
jgi:hypothetical protein